MTNSFGSPLAPLLKRGSDQPLGSIVRSLEEDLKEAMVRAGEGDSCHPLNLNSVWRTYDEAWQGRPDYRFWRTTIKLSSHTKPGPSAAYVSLPRDWGDWTAQATDALRSGNLLVAWGALSVLPRALYLLLQTEVLIPDLRKVWRVVELAESWLATEARPLVHGQAYCGAIAAIFINQVRIFRFAQRRFMSFDQLVSYIRELKTFLRWIDETWEPGEKVRLDNLKREDEAGLRIRPYRAKYTNEAIRSLLAQVSALSSNVIREVNLNTDPILIEVALFARSAWLQARSQRFQEYSYRPDEDEDEDEDESFGPKRERSLREMHLLSWAAVSALDAGDYLESARLNHFLLATAPDFLVTDAEFKHWLQPRYQVMTSAIREAGLLVDERISFNELTAAAPLQIKHPSAARRRLRGFDLRVYRDQNTPLWGPVLAEFPRDPTMTPGAYLHCMLEEIARTEGALGDNARTRRAIFEICLHYGFIQSASRILRCLDISVADVWNFANAVKRCLTNMPFGIDLTTIKTWLKLTSDLCAKPPIYRALTNDQRFFLNELTLGRFLSIQQTNRTHAREIAERYRKPVAAGDLRAFYDDNPTIHKKGPGVISVLGLAQFLASFGDTDLGLPGAVSVRLLPGVHSIVAAAASGLTVTSDVFFGDLRDEAAIVQSGYGSWFAIDGVKFTEQVRWTDGLYNLCREILEVAEDSQPGYRWLVLAIEPELVSLPWQHLVLTLGRRLFQRDIVISLVPNLGWAPLSFRRGRDFGGRVRSYLSNEEDVEFANCRAEIIRQLEALEGRSVDATVAMGHGYWKEDGLTELPEVQISGQVLSNDDWINISGSRVVILHSCHGGRAKAEFLGDFGSIPGMALGMGARLVCAPVAEVPARSAVVLNDGLFGADPKTSIGSSYLSAIVENPVISLYNLYGMAGASIETSMEEKAAFTLESMSSGGRQRSPRQRIRHYDFISARERVEES